MILTNDHLNKLMSSVGFIEMVPKVKINLRSCFKLNMVRYLCDFPEVFSLYFDEE